MKKYLKSIIALTVICAVVTVLLAVTNQITAPIIEKNQSSAANKALLVVMPDGGDFTAVDLTAYELPATVTEAYSASNGGYVFKLVTTGYAPGLTIMCGVDGNGSVTGATCIVSSETNGAEKTYGDSFAGVSVDTVDAIDTVSGSTMTSTAYKGAVKDALNASIILSGGSVDIRSEEEILADSLLAALPAGDKFTEVFICEVLDGITAVYTADNGAGSVYVTGEGEEAVFVGVDANGTVVSAVADDVKANVEAKAKIMADSSMKEIDITKYADMPSHIDKAYKTASGNYVLELHAAGFGINGDSYYNPSGEYIYIKVALTADGKIINCVTTAQSETDGIGSACADKAFYSQFNGKDESSYKDVDAISGATFTTNGYKTGIGKAIEAVKLMEGDA